MLTTDQGFQLDELLSKAANRMIFLQVKPAVRGGWYLAFERLGSVAYLL
jgi:hypothetical protein